MTSPLPYGWGVGQCRTGIYEGAAYRANLARGRHHILLATAGIAASGAHSTARSNCLNQAVQLSSG